ncbi:hypothetical protein [Archangium violaceum]|uniref:Uncharacterized protein n=1 Tax=Archangium violaceum Cb vi76 TaxID=1406225 RepID=A0A084SXK4_9BACT|nr:hypothetical protein [Archangium violaceum]KFA93189.1 hypothetical protein Q664_10900 [Archangium violaceum Cb vi76]
MRVAHPQGATTGLHLIADASLAPATLEQAAPALVRSGLSVVARGGSPRAPARELILFDGRLGPAHAALLERQPPALLLATREPGGLPSAWEMRVLGSLLRGEVLMPPGAPVAKLWLERVLDLKAASSEAAALVEASKGSRSAANLAAEVMHELAANALLDAPVDAQGTPLYAHRRESVQAVAQEHVCQVSLAVGEGGIFLEAVDLFGRLTPGPIARALASLGGRMQVNASGGGAGLGMRRILEACDLIAVRVTPGKETRMLGVVGLGEARRRAGLPKSLLYFQSE